MPTDSDSPVIHSIHCMLNFHYALCFIKRRFYAIFLYFISFRPQRKPKKISALIRSFVVEKPLISNGTLRTNCTLYAKLTNIYGHQKSNIFSNDASRCCFESSNVREGNCVLSRGFIIPSVRELLFYFMCDHHCKELLDGCMIFLFVYGSLVTWY